MTERVVKKGGRYYKKPQKENSPILSLVPSGLDVLKKVFHQPNGDEPSVTTILSALAKPALIGWAAKEERKMISALAADIYQRLYQITDEPIPPTTFIDMLNDEAGKGAHRKLILKAAEVGTEVHKRIEWEFKRELKIERDETTPTLSTPEAENAFQRWTEWRQQVKLKVIAIEKRIFSTLFGYGGTLDLLAEVNGKLSILDFKTGKAIYREAFLQNVAYKMAAMEEGIQLETGWIVRLPKYPNDPDFEAVEVPNDPELATTFLALAVVYRWWVKDKEGK